MDVTAWVDRVLTVIAEERLAMKRRRWQADTATIHRARAIELARLAGFAGYLRYEPESAAPDGD